MAAIIPSYVVRDFGQIARPAGNERSKPPCPKVKYLVILDLLVAWIIPSVEGDGLMGRPREFEAAEALRQAMHVFWSKGYEGASLADILHATGLSKSSLYATFGDKRTL